MIARLIRDADAGLAGASSVHMTTLAFCLASQLNEGARAQVILDTALWVSASQLVSGQELASQRCNDRGPIHRADRSHLEGGELSPRRGGRVPRAAAGRAPLLPTGCAVE